MREKGTGKKGGYRNVCSRGTKDCLWLEKTDVAHRKMFMKGKGKPHVRVRGLILIGHIN